MIIVIDGEKIKSEAELHKFLSEKLQLGGYYGNNSAALWDCLTTDVERPIQVIWKNSEQSQLLLGQDVFTKYVNLFQDVEKQDESFGWNERFTFHILPSM